MSSIRTEIPLRAPPDRVWDAVRDFGAVHRRVAPGFLTDSKLDGRDMRVVTFANGAVARETLVSTDNEQRRLVYAIMEQPFKHYSASVQVFPERDGSRLVWIIDLLPDEAAGYVDQMVQQAVGVMRKTLESA
jgi:carbon monoxide dehydrogenase subunit G